MARAFKIIEFPHSPAGEIGEMGDFAVLQGLLERCALGGAEPVELAEKLLARFGSAGRVFGVPSEGAWQHHLNNAGRYAAQQVLAQLSA